MTKLLMLDTNGYVCEATGENFFIVRNGVIKTPPLTAILDGITRDSIIKIARDLGYTVEEQLFTRDEVYYADEAFFSGTAAELTPIRELDNRTIGEGHAGPVTKALQAAYFKAIKGPAGSPLRPLADQLQVLKPPTGEGNLPRSRLRHTAQPNTA